MTYTLIADVYSMFPLDARAFYLVADRVESVVEVEKQQRGGSNSKEYLEVEVAVSVDATKATRGVTVRRDWTHSTGTEIM